MIQPITSNEVAYKKQYELRVIHYIRAHVLYILHIQGMRAGFLKLWRLDTVMLSSLSQILAT